MQPENSQSAPQRAEQLPMPPSVAQEAIPHLPPLETNIGRGQERFEQAAEAGAIASDAAQAAAVAAPVVPVAPVAPPTDPPAQPVALTTPMTAADEDLIEKEWVDKAKEIIDKTRDDPRARSDQVSALQRDYLQKRYGKVVGANE